MKSGTANRTRCISIAGTASAAKTSPGRVCFSIGTPNILTGIMQHEATLAVNFVASRSFSSASFLALRQCSDKYESSSDGIVIAVATWEQYVRQTKPPTFRHRKASTNAANVFLVVSLCVTKVNIPLFQAYTNQHLLKTRMRVNHGNSCDNSHSNFALLANVE